MVTVGCSRMSRAVGSSSTAGTSGDATGVSLWVRGTADGVSNMFMFADAERESRVEKADRAVDARLEGISSIPCPSSSSATLTGLTVACLESELTRLTLDAVDIIPEVSSSAIPS
jgi:hypothetical protein